MVLPDNFYLFPDYSFAYSIPYLILALFVLLIGKEWIIYNSYQDFPDKRLRIIIVVFCLFFGLRWHLFSDSIEYESVYNGILPESSLTDNVLEFPFIDPGYMLFMLRIKSLGVNYAVFQFINSIIDFVLFYLCVKKYSDNPALTCLFFLAFAGIQIEANLMRNIKAILIFLLSIEYIKDRKLLKYVICVLIATLIHLSSILYLPMYWILNKRWNFGVICGISFFSVVIGVFASDYFLVIVDMVLTNFEGMGGKFASLVVHSQSETEALLSVGSIERLLFLILVLLMYRMMADKSGNAVIFANMYVLYFFLYSIFGFNQVFRERIPILFICAYWFVAPIILTRLQGIPFLKIGLLSLAFLKVYASTNFCPAYYETVLFHDTTIEQREYFNEIMDK